MTAQSPGPRREDDQLNRWSPEWEFNRYARGTQFARYVWSDVVSLTFQYLLGPRAETPRDHMTVLELGCGAGANLLFFAKEGLHVTGVDGSESAIHMAHDSLGKEGFTGDCRVHDFANALPFPDGSFDLVLDRAALPHNSLAVIDRTVQEVHRVLKPQGMFLMVDFYSTAHPNYQEGKEIEGNTKTDIGFGMFQGIGTIHFTSEDELRRLLWRFNISHMAHTVSNYIVPDASYGTAQFNVVAVKSNAATTSDGGRQEP